MIEQQLAERFRAVVGDEPPLGIHPDELVDRLLRQRRRRQAIGVMAVATAAVAGVTTFGGSQRTDPTPTYRVAAPPTATPPPRPALNDESVDAVAGVLPGGKFLTFPVPGRRDVDRFLHHLTVATSGLDKGMLQVRQDDRVFLEVPPGAAEKRDFDYDAPIAVPAGHEVTVAVNCVRTSAADGLCRAGVTFLFTVADR